MPNFRDLVTDQNFLMHQLRHVPSWKITRGSFPVGSAIQSYPCSCSSKIMPTKQSWGEEVRIVPRNAVPQAACLEGPKKCWVLRKILTRTDLYVLYQPAARYPAAGIRQSHAAKATSHCFPFNLLSGTRPFCTGCKGWFGDRG